VSAPLAPPRLQSFPPLADERAEILILGSMPGAASLAAGQYYAHRHNAFWRIIGDLLGVDPAAPYPTRVAALAAAHIALWDVLQSCRRDGSLDTRIDRASEVANPLVQFLTTHRAIRRVYFNGSKAESSFRRLVLPQLDPPGLQLHRLPSTSPAHAALPYAAKLAAWRVLLEPSPEPAPSRNPP
jgi:hypoxanthine-DNA glycosylase